MSNKAQEGPLIAELIEGHPIQAQGRELVPLVRVTTARRRHASLHGDAVTGQGYGFVHMKPVAVLDETEQRRQHRITDQTIRVMGWLTLAAALVPCITTLLIYVAKSLRRSPSEPGPA